ncbi:MAG: sigma-54-dependent Fis family transcriptional regulator [Planctomycetes bacterium]|nr:sigma-54-dependent Fis family transcriptional regulator [Planctomycetota bacterium]
MSDRATVLIVDDHRAVREELAFALDFDGWKTVEAEDGPTGLERAQDPEIDLVLLDVKLPGMDGLEVLQKLKEARPELPVVMISGHGDLDTAVLAVRRGAYDFLQKPFATDRVVLSLKNALRTSRLQSENETLRATIQSEQQLLGTSDAIEHVRATVQKVAPTEVAVLITGDNGTGKELVARQLHLQSRRADGPFLAVNCAAIPEDLAESELFGHEKGAFTGADAARAGVFERANGGTLFLDEVAEMPVELQTRLLRALETRTVRRVGGSRDRSIDVRIVSATNRAFDRAIEDGTLREDLFHRLCVFPIVTPPLRERGDDVLLLANGFLTEFGDRELRLSERTAAALRSSPWPGNVRQLRNAMQHAAMLAEGDTVTTAELPPHLLADLDGHDELAALADDAPASAPAAPAAEHPADPPAEHTADADRPTSGGADAAADSKGHLEIEVGVSIQEAERRLIEATLAAHDGDKRSAAEVLGVSLRTLYNRLNTYEDGE